MDFHIFLPLFLRTVTGYERKREVSLSLPYKTRRAKRETDRKQKAIGKDLCACEFTSYHQNTVYASEVLVLLLVLEVQTTRASWLAVNLSLLYHHEATMLN